MCDGLDIVLVMQHFYYITKIFEALQIFFSMFLSKWGIKSTKFWNSSLNLEFLIFNFNFLFFSRFFWSSNFFLLFFTLYFFENGHIHNVASTLSNVVNINVDIENVDSTLFNVVNFNVDIHNIVSTLVWRRPTSRSHINLTTTLKQCWNVCWVIGIFNIIAFYTTFNKGDLYEILVKRNSKFDDP